MWCRSSLSGRADALYVVNDALGSFLLRASEVIDQVPISACDAVDGSSTGTRVPRMWGHKTDIRECPSNVRFRG
jgi:hypothetical protein